MIKKTIFAFTFFIGIFSLFADQMSDIEDNFKRDRIMKTRYLLERFSPVNENEKAFKLYYQFKVSMDEVSCIQYLDELISKYPENEFGKKAHFAKSELLYLKKDFSNALKLLDENGTFEEINLISKIYFDTKQFDKAILILNKLLPMSESYDQREIILMRIAKCNTEKNDYISALKSLNVLRESLYINHLMPEMFYYIGYCHQMMNEPVEAKKYYSKLISDFPYDEFSLKAKEQIALLDNFDASQIKENSYNSESTTENKGNLFLQAGAFSSKNNAQKRVNEISKMGYSASVWEIDGKFKVAVGPYTEKSEILYVKNNLKNKGINSFVTKK